MTPLRAQRPSNLIEVGDKFDLIDRRLDSIIEVQLEHSQQMGSIMSEVMTLKALMTPARQRLPSMSEYNPEHTPHGGISIPQDAWKAILERIANLDADKAKAEAEKAGADKLVAVWAGRAKVLGPVLVATAGFVGWLLTHVFHW